ncbi:uncharacterized protein JN550_008381 [Neoarthrinium moseri]|uniref:uncharacterized protein n=1 Tax=Neoarthrinium moseri TaxID=1658444 RepID=UPI001FDE57EE|nr:uncharacterized protein JN550_008381 [Neoarthrinium moseri]KAI1865333.1 hypothetical protein JN550_008381 [Neoarthrinium moseri]
MSANILANEGVSLVKASKYAEGIEKLSQALKAQPAPVWFLERSKAYLRTNEVQRALNDAEQALSIAFERANRDLMADAQIRRAIALFRLDRYADADICAFWAIRLVEGARASEDDGQQNKVNENGDYTVTAKEVQDANQAAEASKKNDGLSAAMGGERSKSTTVRNLAFSWRIQALTKMDQLEAGAPGRKVNVARYPKTKVQVEEVDNLHVDEPAEEPNKPKIPAHILPGLQPEPSDSGSWAWDDVWREFRAEHAKHDIRTDFYQNDTTLNVSFFVKNVPKDEFRVDAQEQRVTLGPIPNTPSGSLTLHLLDKIRPADTTHTVKSMKVELVLRKAIPGKWGALRPPTASIFDNITIGQASHGTRDEFIGHARSLGYDSPSSFSKNAFGDDTRAWYLALLDKLSPVTYDTVNAPAPPQSTPDATPLKPSTVEAVTKENATPNTAAPASSAGPSYPTSSKSGPKNWDAIDLDEDDNPEGVDDFFKKLYKDADPDMRRAMMKSYVESNGTSLSTSWEEASKKSYTTSPPDGVEAKKWDK